MPYHFKNGQGDECLFVHYGSGTLYTMFGTLKFAKKDYIVIPKGTIYQMVFDERPDDGSDDETFGGYSKADMPYRQVPQLSRRSTAATSCRRPATSRRRRASSSSTRRTASATL